MHENNGAMLSRFLEVNTSRAGEAKGSRPHSAYAVCVGRNVAFSSLHARIHGRGIGPGQRFRRLKKDYELAMRARKQTAPKWCSIDK